MIKKLSVVIIALLAIGGGIFAFVNGRGAQKSEGNQKLKVVTTNSILEDMVDQVGGDDVDVYSIVKRGTDPHAYDPTTDDIAAATDADVLFHNGLNLETGGSGWFNKLTDTANKHDDKEVFAVSKNVKPLYLTEAGKENETDPHAWLDVSNGVKYVKLINSVLKDKDPDNAKAYQKRTDAYVEKLEKLHKEAQNKFADIPEEQRLLVTSEGAFKYFSKAYDIKPAFIWEINTESQGTPEQMKQVLAKIDQSEVKSLFVESSVSPKSMNQVSKETGLPIHSKIYTDSLAKKGTQGDTYYDMVKWNIDKIHDGMLGKE